MKNILYYLAYLLLGFTEMMFTNYVALSIFHSLILFYIMTFFAYFIAGIFMNLYSHSFRKKPITISILFLIGLVAGRFLHLKLIIYLCFFVGLASYLFGIYWHKYWRNTFFKSSIIIWSGLVLFFSFKIIPELVYTQGHQRVSSNITPNLYLKTLNNKILTNTDVKGKVVLLDFWYTSCGLCLIKMPYVEKLAEQYKDNQKIMIIVVGMSKTESFEAQKKWIEKNKYQLMFTYDTSDTLSQQLNFNGAPFEAILDKNGIVRNRHQGFNQNMSELYISKTSTILDKLLTEK